jgi:hypothetical protein
MPESKTIEIDEIVTPEKPPGDEPSAGSKKVDWSQSNGGASRPDAPSGNPFADFQKALPWKARLTLGLTQWFMVLRSKSWGKLVIVPAVILGLLLVIPLGLLFISWMIIRSFLRSFTR